jgi:hypothetical protein
MEELHRGIDLRGLPHADQQKHRNQHCFPEQKTGQSQGLEHRIMEVSITRIQIKNSSPFVTAARTDAQDITGGQQHQQQTDPINPTVY